MQLISEVPASAIAVAHRVMQILGNALYPWQHDDEWSFEDYGIDPETAFFPRQPLAPLQGPFSLWEVALKDAPSVLRLGTDDSPEAVVLRPCGALWRENLRMSPVVSITSLSDTPSLQRAHFLLASLVHWFAHSITAPEGVPIHIPEALAVPLVEVSLALRIAPVLTFADTVLWNWDYPSGSCSDQGFMPRNPRFINLFSRTEDEENFYIASAQAEIVGVEALHVLHAHAARSNIHDEDSVCELAAGLDRIADMIEDISTTIQSVRGAVNPRIFYDEVRPWYVGSTAERPWIYDGVEETKLELDGPSAGQSAIMHMLDVFLDINHAAPTRSMPSHVQRGPVSGGFMERMRRYMPGSQRDFLEHLAVSQHPVRELARAHPELLGPYNRAVRALTRLRDHHIRIATLYIVSMAKSAPVCPFMRGAARSAAATRAASAPAKGTGGNEVSLLLKAGRDATKRAILEA